jgi:hypothetical protein
MTPPPHRTALFALVLLVLVGAGTWWLSHRNEGIASPPIDRAVAASGGVATPLPRPVSGSLPPNLTGDHPDGCGKAIRDAFNARARLLAQREDANSQLAFAMAVPIEAPVDSAGMDQGAMRRALEERHAEQQRAILHAAELAPTRPDVLFLAATFCGSGDACRDVQQALLKAEPDNLAAWLRETGWAKRRGDPAAVQRAFERAAQATRNDSHADSALQALVDAYGGVPMPVECSTDAAKAAMRREMGMDHDFSMLDQALLIAGASRAGTLPSYNDIRLHCKPQPGVTMAAATWAGCRNIMTRMADGDTWIERSIALGTMVQLAADDPDASVWRERYRGDRWIIAQLADRDVQRLLKPEDYVLDEARAAQAALEVLGRWPPPPDWLPRDEHARSLIQTGHPPPPKTR